MRRGKRTKDSPRCSSPWKDQPDGDRRQNSRYCSDPCKAAAALQGIASNQGNRFQSPNHQASMFNYPSSATSFCKDDYLLPKQTEQPVKYLDLADENGKLSNTVV